MGEGEGERETPDDMGCAMPVDVSKIPGSLIIGGALIYFLADRPRGIDIVDAVRRFLGR